MTDVASAQHAIDIIVQQGEGTQQSPLNPKNVAAHYYQFQQFSKRMRIKPNPASPYDVSFDPTQPLVIDDTDDVIQMIDDPATVTYHEADTDAETLSKEADMAYSEMLRVLHMGFNGQPGKVHDAIGVMVGKFRKAVDDLLHQQLTAEAHTGLFAHPLPLHSVSLSPLRCASYGRYYFRLLARLSPDDAAFALNRSQSRCAPVDMIPPPRVFDAVVAPTAGGARSASRVVRPPSPRQRPIQQG